MNTPLDEHRPPPGRRQPPPARVLRCIVTDLSGPFMGPFLRPDEGIFRNSRSVDGAACLAAVLDLGLDSYIR